MSKVFPTLLLLALCISTAARGNEPWTLTEPRLDHPEAIRVLVVHDMEGLSGQENLETFFIQFDDYALGQELLAGDVNAAVAGFFDGGAAEVHVVDGHGSGNPQPDLRPDLLDPRAKQLSREKPFDPYFGPARENEYDAIAMVGGHARTGTGGFAAHTLTLGMDVIINGLPVTETEIVALAWGLNGKPVILATGDDKLAENLADRMPWVETPITKTAIDHSTARARPIEESRRDIRAAARRAIENIGQAKAMQITTPIEMTLRSVPPASLAAMENVPGVNFWVPGWDPNDSAVTFEANGLYDAVTGLKALVMVARGGYLMSTIEQFEREGELDAFDRFYRARVQVWTDQESGRLQQPPQNTRRQTKTTVYYGAR